jgi:hypothetical protein
MAGHTLSLKWTALFYLILISLCCNFAHGAVIERAPVASSQECGEYEGAACPEPNESRSLDFEGQEWENLEKRGDGTESRAFTPVTGASGMAPRLPIMVLRNQNPDVFNMLLLALERVQSWPEDRILSWFQITGNSLPVCRDDQAV